MRIVSCPCGSATDSAGHGAPNRTPNPKRQIDDDTTSKITITQTITRVSSTWTTVATLHKGLPSEPPAQSTPIVTNQQLGGIIGGTVAALLLLLVLVCCWCSSQQRTWFQYSSSKDSSPRRPRRNGSGAGGATTSLICPGCLPCNGPGL